MSDSQKTGGGAVLREDIAEQPRPIAGALAELQHARKDLAQAIEGLIEDIQPALRRELTTPAETLNAEAQDINPNSVVLTFLEDERNELNLLRRYIMDIRGRVQL